MSETITDLYTNSRANRTGDEPAGDGPSCRKCKSIEHLVPHSPTQDMSTIAGDPSLLGKPHSDVNWPTQAKCDQCGNVQQVTVRHMYWIFFAVGARLQRYWMLELDPLMKGREKLHKLRTQLATIKTHGGWVEELVPLRRCVDGHVSVWHYLTPSGNRVCQHRDTDGQYCNGETLITFPDDVTGPIVHEALKDSTAR